MRTSRPICSDALLLIGALERHDVTDLSELETDAMVNLYTLRSDVQRDANEFRKEIADVLLTRLHHDRAVSGQYGSVQRTSRRNRSLKDDDEVLERLENAGIDRERVLSVDRSKVDEALDVTTLSESDVYEIEEREFVRKAEVDEDVKESRLQGLKDRLAASEDDEADQLRAEIEALEQRISDLTSFRTGAEMQEWLFPRTVPGIEFSRYEMINQQNGVLCSLLVNPSHLFSLLGQKGNEIANRIYWQLLLSKDSARCRRARVECGW